MDAVAPHAPGALLERDLRYGLPPAADLALQLGETLTRRVDAAGDLDERSRAGDRAGLGARGGRAGHAAEREPRITQSEAGLDLRSGHPARAASAVDLRPHDPGRDAPLEDVDLAEPAFDPAPQLRAELPGREAHRAPAMVGRSVVVRILDSLQPGLG